MSAPADFERQKWLAELRLREEELALKRIEASRSRWNNPLTIAVLAAALAGGANAGVAWLSGVSQRDLERDRAESTARVEERRATDTLRLERLRAEATRILEVIKVGDPDKAAPNLEFLVNIKLVSDETAKNISSYLATRKRGEGASLPEPSGAPPMRDFMFWGSALKGRSIADIQARLKELGFYKDNPEGFFGPATLKAVREFQAQRGLTVDGIVGSQTDEALFGPSPPPR